MENLKFPQVSHRGPFPTSRPADAQGFSFGPFELDTDKHLLLRDGIPVPLQPKCFDLLCALIKSHNRLVAKDHLMRVLWPDTFVEESNLSNLIAALRKALGDSPAQSQFIQTVPKLGYRFSGPVASPVASISRARAPAIVDSARAIRIIVFPFRAGIGFEDQDLLTQALPDAISSSLAEFNAFVVRSTQLAMGFDPVHWDPKTVAKEADVDFIVSGSLGPSAAEIHAVIQLIAAETGTIVWSKSWDFPKSDLVRLHEAVVLLIAHTLVRAAGVAPSPQPGTPSHPEAYNAYLRANQLCANRTQVGTALARDLYVECLEKDPDFAPAWARLGRCYHVLRKFGTEKGFEENAAWTALETAFRLDPELVLAHNLYTPIQADAGEADKAMVRLLGQLRSHANAPELLSALVHACRYCGQLDASIAAHKKALQLDPHVRTSVTHSYFAMADFDRALSWYGTSAGLYLDVLALAGMNREKEASALMWARREKFDSLPGPMYSLDAYLRGDREKGIAVLRDAMLSSRYEPELQFYMARQAAKFDDIDLASSLLTRSADAGYWSSIALQRDPWLASLRGTSGFQNLLASVKLREAEARLAFLGAGGELVLGGP